MRRAALMTALIVGVLAAVKATGTPQSTPPAPTQEPAAPVFRTGVDLVRLDVRVTDPSGQPIRDLRADEVRVVEGGDERPILLFQHVEQPIGTYTEVAQRTITSEVSTNQGSPRGHVYVLVFDEAHIAAGNEQRARMAAERFLRTRVRPGDRVALYAIPGPGPSIDFTSDVKEVLDRLISVRGSQEETGRGALGEMRLYDAYEIVRGNQEILGRYADQAATTALAIDTRASDSRASLLRGAEDPAVLRQQVLDSARGVVARADDESRRFLRSLADVIATLRAVDGRKAVLLFSEGFEVDNVTDELELVAAAAAQSYSVVYGIDLNVRAVSVTQQDPMGGQQLAEVRSRLQSLGSLTAETDGELFIDAVPRLDSIMNRIGETTEDYYLIGFAPSDAGLRDHGRYRRVQVTVTRPGARVSTRSGYAMNAKATPADRRTSIDAALRAPFSQQGLHVEYTTYVFRGSTPGVDRVIVSLDAQLPVATAQGGAADVVYAVRSVRDGRLAASGSGQIVLPEANQPGDPTGVGHYRVQVELPPGVYLMRAVVREPGGLLGSADRRFTVRALGGPSLSASDLVIGSSDVSGLPVRTTVYNSEALSGVFELYARSPDRLEAVDVGVELLPVGTTVAVTSTHAQLDPIRQDESGARRGARVELPLEGVAPGLYLARATVRTGAETATELLRDVVVMEGTRPEPPAPLSPAVFDPSAVLHGELVRNYVNDLQGRAPDSLQRAASLATEQAWDQVEPALAGSPASGAANALRGLARFAQSDFPGAANAWTATLDADPTDAHVAFLLGWAHAAAGDDRSAITAWRLASLRDPTLVPPYLALIDAYMRLGQPALALQVTRSGLAVLPNSPELRDRLHRLERH